MFTISQRHSPDSGIRLWRVSCPKGHVIGYEADLCRILVALAADGETAIRLETDSAVARLALLDAPGVPNMGLLD